MIHDKRSHPQANTSTVTDSCDLSNKDSSATILVQTTRSELSMQGVQAPLVTAIPESTGRLLEGQNDIAVIETWLRTVARSPNTFNSYAKEAYRFLRFMALRGKGLAQITVEDLLAYRQLLVSPTPLDDWVADASYPRNDPRWRPFVARRGRRIGLSVASIRQSVAILATMFRWLSDAGHITRNPMVLVPRERVRDETSVTRYLPPHLQDALLSWIDRMPHDNERAEAHFHRVRWVFNLLLLSGLRASEVSSTRMGDFVHDTRLKEGGWWLCVTGKRNKRRMIPVPDRLITAMQSYRQHLGLDPLPTPGETTPLVGSVFLAQRKKDQPIGRYAVFRIIKEVAKSAAADFEKELGLAAANHLKSVSTHWLRHSYGSSLADHGADVRTIQENMGHESYETSNQYLHIDAARRHRQTAGL